MPEPIPLRAVPPAALLIRIQPPPERVRYRLRSWLPEVHDGRQPVLLSGRALPVETGATLPDLPRVLCLGPGDWLLVSQPHQAATLREQLEPAASRCGLAWTEMTDGLAMLEVSGAAVRELLAKGCGLDLHPRAFPPGRCARTRLAQIAVVVDCRAATRFELYVARSHAAWLHDWLADAASEP